MAENLPRLDDESRFELAMTAAAKERRNRPRTLLLIAGALLAAAATAAVLGLSARGTAQSFYRSEQINAAQIDRMIDEHRELSARQDTGPNLGPMPYIVTQLGELAQQAGMAQALRPPQMGGGAVSSTLKSVEYVYQGVQDPSLEAILKWLLLAEQQIEGLEVYEIRNFKPLPSGNWHLDVVFRRWERTA